MARAGDRSRMKRRTTRVIGVLLLVTVGLLAVGVGAAWQRYQGFLGAPLDIPADGLVLRVQPGDPVLGVIDRLDRLGATRNDGRWRLLLNRHPVTIQTGEYAIPADATPEALLELLERGDVIQYRFTIVEGWTIVEAVQATSVQRAISSCPLVLSV